METPSFPNQRDSTPSPAIDPAEAGDATDASRPTGDDRRPLSSRSIFLAAVIGVVAALGLVALLAGGGSGGDDPADLAGLEFVTVDGSTATLAAYEGQPLVVNFFASWCAPCRAELPDMEKVHLARGDSVTFLGVNHDLDEATWRSFVDESAISYDTVFQPDTEIFTAVGALGMPSTAFITPEGDVAHLHTGLVTDDLLESLIDEYLGSA